MFFFFTNIIFIFQLQRYAGRCRTERIQRKKVKDQTCYYDDTIILFAIRENRFVVVTGSLPALVGRWRRQSTSTPESRSQLRVNNSNNCSCVNKNDKPGGTRGKKFHKYRTRTESLATVTLGALRSRFHSAIGRVLTTIQRSLTQTPTGRRTGHDVTACRSTLARLSAQFKIRCWFVWSLPPRTPSEALQSYYYYYY